MKNFILSFYLALLALSGFGQTSAQLPVSAKPQSDFPKTTKIFADVGLFGDTIVHLVWANVDSANIKEVVLETSDDGINFKFLSKAIVSSLTDIHANNYPTWIDYFNHILLSSESGHDRLIYNDIINPKTALRSKWYRIKMLASSGDLYISQYISVVVNENGKDNNPTFIANDDNNLPWDNNESNGKNLKGGGGSKPGCNPVGTVPSGATPIGQSVTYYGSCCYWVETGYHVYGAIYTNCGSSYAWCCNSVPGASSCSSGYVSDPCCVHYCSQYYQCSCPPWQCCSQSVVTTWIVTQSVNLTPPVATNNGPYCPGQTIQLNSSGTTSYNWTGPGGFSSPSQNPAIGGASTSMSGVYTVTSPSGSGCSAQTNVVVYPTLTISVSNNGPVCDGQNIQINATSNGTSFNWSGPGGFTSTQQNLSFPNAAPSISGTYIVTVSDVNGCTATAQTTVTVNPNPVPSASNTGPYCEGEIIQLNSSGGTIYNWAGPGGYTNATQNPTIPGSTSAMSGDYYVTISDGNGCLATTITSVVVNIIPSASIAGTDVLCYGDATGAADLTVTGGTPSYTYNWSSGDVTEDLSNIVAGTYSVTVTDANGCTATATITINQPAAPLSASIVGTDILCYGDATGAADLTVTGGTIVYTYNWSNGATTEDLANISAGTYTVTVTDANGCTITASVTLFQPAAPLVASIAGTDVLCYGDATGAADLTVTGGTTAYIYAWNSGDVTEDLANLVAGTYSVTITDANGCTTTASITINQPAAPLAASIVGTDVLCFGDATGAADLTVTGGTTAYTYSWSSGDVTEDLSNIIAGTYSVTVTDANGCTTTATITINQPAAPLAASIIGTNILCFGDATGAADLTVTGGTIVYTYNWSNGSTTEDLANIPAGIYTVTVTDANGCTITASVTINQPAAPLVASIAGTDVLCFGDATGAADLTVTGGTTAYIYSWSSGDATEDLANLVAGTYSVTVTDANSCTITASITINQPAAPLSATLSGINVLCFGDATGSITLTPNGGTTPYSYNWSNGATTEDLNNIPAGSYTVTVTDANSCNVTASFFITQPAAPLTASIVGTDVLCFGNSTGAADLTVTGGTTAYIYNWSSGDVTEDLSNIPAGTYTVTVTDANGCTITASITITQPAAPLVASIAGTDVLCFGDATGAADLTVTGGTIAYTYSWSSGDVTEDLANIVAGTYSVTVTDANGCTITASITINQPAASLSTTLSGVNVLCFGDATGSIDLTPNGGTTPYFYNWSNSATTQDLSNIPAGSYTVTVTDANSCTVAATLLITQPAAPLAATIAGTNVLCFGNSTGAANLTVTGGTTAYTYNWSNGTTSQNLNNIPAGTYSVTVTDANACSTSALVVIIQPAAGLTTTLTGTNVLCFGNSTGATDLTVAGGTPAYSYNWSNGATTEDLSNIPSGSYTVTVTDANGCTVTNTITITQPVAPLSATLSGTNVLCFGDATGSVNLTANGGTPSYTYNWSNGATTQNINNLPVGSYTVTVTDANSCTVAATLLITQPAAPLAATIAGTNVLCFGNSTGAANLTVTGGTTAYTYNWSNGTTSQNLNNIPAGTYSVTVTDANGCTITASVVITQPTAPLVAFIAGTDVLCFGDATGAADLTVTGGTIAYSYSWSSGDVTEDLANIVAGTYFVTVTDANGCTITASITINQPAAPLSATLSGTNVLCFGDATGSIDLTPNGGTTPYSYSWSNGATTEDLNNIPAGSYTVTVTDANSCTVAATLLITQPAAPLSASISGTNILCYGQSTGAADLTVTGGTTSYSYNWSNGTTSQNLNNIPAGVYTVTVTDANGCTITATITLTQPAAPLTTSLSGSNILCFGGTVGGANSAVSGGTPGYSYSWNNGATTPDLSNIPFGTYTLTITDANGCTNSSSILIAQPASPLSATVTGVNILCYGDATGSTDLTATGGTPGYTYTWSNGSVTEDLSGIPAGTYTVTVTDNYGCTTSVSITLTQPAVPLSANVSGTNVLCFGNSTGAADLTVSGGTPNYFYQWNNGVATEDLSGIPAGVYSVTVTDANGCTITSGVTITQPAAPLTATLSGTNILCFGNSTGAIVMTVNGGTPAYVYNWSNGATTQDISNLTAGTYSVTVTDNNGCTTTQTITLTEPSLLTFSFTTQDVSCFSGSDGVASGKASGGAGSYVYAWLPAGTGGNVPTLNNLSAGTYTFIVTDANGCTADTTFTMIQPPLLTLTYITDSVNCYGGNDGMITVTATGGNGLYTYTWSPSVSTGTIASGLAAGTYSVTVTDHKSCSTSASINVAQPSPIILTTTGNVSICNGNSTTICASASGGTGSYTFIWNLGNGNCFTVSPLTTTTYTVSAYDSYGCSAVPQSLTVLVSSPISVVATAKPASICIGESTVITAMPSGGNGNFTYSWNQGGSTPTINVTPATTTMYAVTVTDNCGSLPGIDSVLVIVNPMPVVMFTSDNTNGCEPLAVNFSDLSTPTIGSWLWDFGDPLSGSNSSTIQNPGHLYTHSGTYTVTLTVTTTNGCTGSYTFQNMITVYPNPDAMFSLYPHVGSTQNPVISFADHSTNAASWNWDFGDLASGNDNTSSLQNPQHSYSGAGSFTVFLLVESSHGCRDTASNSVLIEQDFIFYAPNAFTPDENGVNDFFVPKGEGWDPDNFALYIYNRWGALVFETKDVTKHWDGRALGSNNIVPQDVYVWLVILKDINGIKHSFNGRVTVIRKD